MSTPFPMRNLPGPSENWGRAIEARIVALETSLDRLEQAHYSTQKAAASTLGVLGRQVEGNALLKNFDSVTASGPFVAARTSADPVVDSWTPVLPSIEGIVAGTNRMRIDMSFSMTSSGGLMWYILQNADIPTDITRLDRGQALTIPQGSGGFRTWYAAVTPDTKYNIIPEGYTSSGSGVMTSFSLSAQSVPSK